MKFIKRLSSLLLVFIFLFTTSGCNKQNDNFYVEHSLKGELVELNIQEFKDVVASKSHLVVFINSATCSACKMIKEEFLNDFVNETMMKVYSYQLNQNRVEEVEFITSIVPEDSEYVTECYDENQIPFTCFFVPLILVIEDGKTIKDALGTKEISRNFFDENIITSNNKKYVVEPKQKLKLVASSNPGFIAYENQVQEGIIYHTKDKDINEEMKYYLEPLIEDYRVNIYVDYDSSYSKNTLEIKTSSTSVKETNLRNYMSFLKSYTYF